MANGVPIEAATPAEARVWTVLLRDLVTRLRGQASAALQVVGAVSVGGDAVVTGALAVGGASTLGGAVAATTTLTAGGKVTASAGLDVGGAFHPATPTGAGQTAVSLYAGTGVPNNANGANGDYYLRSDGGAGTAVYQKVAGAWVGRA